MKIKDMSIKELLEEKKQLEIMGVSGGHIPVEDNKQSFTNQDILESLKRITNIGG